MSRPAQFLTDLVVRKLKWDNSSDGRGTWRTFAPLQFYSAILDAVVEVPSDFLTDFASVPRLPVVFLFMGNDVHEAAVVHDWLYSTKAVGERKVTREEADDVFKEACIASGSSKLKSALFHQGVRLGGSGPWEARGQPQAPHVEQKIAAAQMEAP